MVLNWKTGGLLLGFVFFLAVLLVKPIGVSTQFVILDGIIGDAVNTQLVTQTEDGYTSTNAYLAKSNGKYAKSVSNPLNYSFVFVLAMMAGAFLSTLLKGGLSREERTMPGIWRANFGDSAVKRFAVAFVGGFYEEFIYSLQKVNLKAFKLLFNGRFKSFFRYTNANFLALLVSGMLISYFSVSRLLDYFLDKKELFVWASFFGMILGSIYYISKDYNHWNRQTITAGVVGLLMGLSISFLSPAKENDNLLFIFFCGIISVSGMTLPGLSGSFILILMGNYVLLLVDSVNALYDTLAEVFRGDFSFWQNAERIRTLKILAVFTLGSATGLVTLSHLLGYVLKRYHETTTAVIIGFITGSLGVLWPWKQTIYKTDALGNFLLDSNGDKIIRNYQRYWPDWTSMETWGAVFFIILGIFVLLALDWYGRNRKERKKVRAGR